MNTITEETRRDSFYSTNTSKRKKAILEVLGDSKMTARMIAYALGFTDLNAVKPRLTELCNMKKIEAVGKKKDFITGKMVAIYKVVG